MPKAVLHLQRPLVAAALIAMSLPAFAASQRAFVASYGQDANAALYGCSLAHPCRTFAGALPQVNSGGEVVALDSAGYGAFTVDKAVSVIAPPAVQASITVTAGTGITVAASPSDFVRLAGLAVVGQGGNAGIAFQSGAALTVDRCTVSGALYAGVEVLSGGTARIVDSTLEINATSYATAVSIVVPNHVPILTEIIRSRLSNSNGDGIIVSANARLAVHDSTLAGRPGGTALETYASGLGGPISAHVSRSMITGWSSGVKSLQSTPYSSVDVVESDLVGNIVAAIADQGTIALDRTRVVHSITGVQTINGGVVYTSGNNYFAYNVSDLYSGTTLSGPGGNR